MGSGLPERIRVFRVLIRVPGHPEFDEGPRVLHPTGAQQFDGALFVDTALTDEQPIDGTDAEVFPVQIAGQVRALLDFLGHRRSPSRDLAGTGPSSPRVVSRRGTKLRILTLY